VELPRIIVAKKKNRTLAGPVLSLAGKPAITFQRGTAACIAIATWEEQRSLPTAQMKYVPHRACEQRG
jgi:hypothetical protein